MTEFDPIVSVIIPTYNYANWIGEAIDSVLNSDFSEGKIEIIVVDDGSTDDTSARIETYKDRVKYIAQENCGKAWATKIGIDNAKGKYLFNLDADDLFLPNKIKEVINIFEKDKNIFHVAHPAICWNVNDNTKTIESIPRYCKGRKIFGKDLLSYFYKRKMLFGGGSTFAARSEILKQIVIPKEVDMFIDEYLVLFTLGHGYTFFIDQPLSIWRIHGKNFSNMISRVNIDETKMQRSMNGMKAVLSALLESNFEEDIKKLYLLKIKMSEIAIKEQEGRKSFWDIMDLWKYILANLRIFGLDIFRIIKNYTILNRSLPTHVLRLLKQLKGLSA